MFTTQLLLRPLRLQSPSRSRVAVNLKSTVSLRVSKSTRVGQHSGPDPLLLSNQFKSVLNYFGRFGDCRKMSSSTSCCSASDPNSFSNPDEVRVDHHDIRWTVDFDRKLVSGEVRYELSFVKAGAAVLKLDTRDLEIKSVTETGTGKGLEYELGEAYLSFGRPLTVQLGGGELGGGGGGNSIRIEYSTRPTSSALQWLGKEQTAGKEWPYMFSQCQPFHARSLLPCQDTPSVKSTFTSTVTAPAPLTVLMSAVRSTNDDPTTHSFHQPVPIPSYLIAIVTGKLHGKKIGPRTTVWAEESYLTPATVDFADTEEYIKIAESLVGEYVWGVYDLLVLPPSFPYGGMENPCLTFVTPTLLAGDKSLANVVAHEIAHSWTGNLVTNKNWEHFWLNEGFTVFLERKIIGRMYGEPFRQLKSISGMSTLRETVETLGEGNPFTGLVLDLVDTDPDESFSSIPYEKGYLFLYYLEELVGGAEVFEPFFKSYIQEFKHKSIGTSDFQEYFNNYFKNIGVETGGVDWTSWLYKRGMPSYTPDYDKTLLDPCTALATRWLEWDPAKEPNNFKNTDLDEFQLKSHQVEVFLEQLLSSSDPLDLVKVAAMETAYNLSSSSNYEVLFSWIRVGLRSGWEEIVPLAVRFVTEQNRMKFIRPVYRELFKNPEWREEALKTFELNRNGMMHVAVAGVGRDLGVK